MHFRYLILSVTATPLGTSPRPNLGTCSPSLCGNLTAGIGKTWLVNEDQGKADQTMDSMERGNSGVDIIKYLVVCTNRSPRDLFQTLHSPVSAGHVGLDGSRRAEAPESSIATLTRHRRSRIQPS